MDTNPDAVQALEANFWSMFRVMGSGPGGTIVDTPGRLIVESPLPQPPYNSVLRFRGEGDEPLQPQVDEIWKRFRSRGVTGIFVVHPTSPPDLRATLTASGLERAELILGMIRDLDGSLPPAPDIEGVEIGEADEAAGADWVHLVTWRYGLESTHESYLRRMYAEAIGTHTRLWLARVDGEPVSKVVLHVADGVAGIYGVATTEAGRGRGLASSLTLHALQAARDAGATVSVLHSTPMAHGLYTRLGYRDIAPFEIWAEPDQVHL
jgi:GNAT superfamily N-acetyltransferase